MSKKQNRKQHSKFDQLNDKPSSEDFEEFLRSAQPHLIARVEIADNVRRAKVTPIVTKIHCGWDELLDEGYEAHDSPLGPVYWRIVMRGNEQLYLSTFLVVPAQVIEIWGMEGLAYRNAVTGMTAARMETLLDPSLMAKL